MSANMKTELLAVWMLLSHNSKGQNPVLPHPAKTMLLFEARKVITSPCPHVISGSGGFCPFS